MRSNLLKTLDKLRSAINSSTVDIGRFSLWMSSFFLFSSSHISADSHSTPVFLGTTTSRVWAPWPFLGIVQLFQSPYLYLHIFPHVKMYASVALRYWWNGGVYRESDHDSQNPSPTPFCPSIAKRTGLVYYRERRMRKQNGWYLVLVHLSFLNLVRGPEIVASTMYEVDFILEPLNRIAALKKKTRTSSVRVVSYS